MTKTAFDKISEGLAEALEIARGDAKPRRLYVPPEIDKMTYHAVPGGWMIDGDDNVYPSQREALAAKALAAYYDELSKALAAYDLSGETFSAIQDTYRRWRKRMPNNHPATTYPTKVAANRVAAELNALRTPTEIKFGRYVAIPNHLHGGWIVTPIYY